MRRNSKGFFVFAILAVVILMVYWIFRYDQSDVEIESMKKLPKSEETVELHASGLIQAEGIIEVINNCTQCHSAEIIKQNRLTAEQWRNTIQWMQETQNLWELGKNEEIIINYLVANYPAVKKGRRSNLSEIEWYVLE